MTSVEEMARLLLHNIPAFLLSLEKIQSFFEVIMKAPIEKLYVQKLHETLKWFINEYKEFDIATTLSADYCITAEGLDALTDEILRRKELKSRSHLRFILRSDEEVDELLFAAR